MELLTPDVIRSILMVLSIVLIFVVLAILYFAGNVIKHALGRSGGPGGGPRARVSKPAQQQLESGTKNVRDAQWYQDYSYLESGDYQSLEASTGRWDYLPSGYEGAQDLAGLEPGEDEHYYLGPGE